MRLIALTMLLAVASSAMAASPRTFVGHAWNESGTRLLYRETHRETYDGGRRATLETTYTDPDGRVIAERTVDFGDNALAPTFELVDHRAGYREGLVVAKGLSTVFSGDRKHEPPRRRSVDADGILVADAGFDSLVRTYWERLRAGDEVVVEFLVPSRLDTVAFSITTTGASLVRGEPAVTFQMVPRNPFLRWLVEPIRVTYHARLKHLLRYEGISNLKGADGRTQTVRIEFPMSETAKPAEVDRAPENTDD